MRGTQGSNPPYTNDGTRPAAGYKTAEQRRIDTPKAYGVRGRLFLHRFNGKNMRVGLAEKVRIGQAAETLPPRRFRLPRDGIL